MRNCKITLQFISSQNISCDAPKLKYNIETRLVIWLSVCTKDNTHPCGSILVNKEKLKEKEEKKNLLKL